MLLNLGDCADAETLGRRSLERRRRVLGRDHYDTPDTPGNLATSLSRQDKHAQAAEIERDALVSRTRLLGSEHERTLLAANNLVFSLAKCGQKMEAKQLLHEALALFLRALGPAHPITQGLLKEFDALSRAAP